MEKDQIDLIIRAAGVLQKKKEFYDYLVIILPVLTAFLGWFASTWWQWCVIVRNTKKEHYYVTREKVELIVENFHSFLDYMYAYHKVIKNDVNLMEFPDEDAFNDFVTEYQFKLASIHQKLKIIFPGKRFPIINITKEMKILEENILQWGEVVRALRDPNSDVAATKELINGLNKRNYDSINSVTKETTAIENAVIEILNEKAKKLKLCINE